MKRFIHSVRPVVVATFAFAISINAAACADPDGPLRASLDAAVRDGVNERELARRLDVKFDVRERGTQSWDDLQSFLSREDPSDFRPLRDAVEKYPRILYHTTVWTMTWVFVDDKGVVRGYWLTAQ